MGRLGAGAAPERSVVGKSSLFTGVKMPRRLRAVKLALGEKTAGGSDLIENQES